MGGADAADAYEDQLEDESDEIFEIEPGNWPAIQAFFTVQTQFRASGFRYEAVHAGLELAGIHCTSELFQKLRYLEGGALKELQESKSRENEGGND